jgi:hypothetical protein
MAQARGPERVREMVEALRKWQSIERSSIEQSARIIERAANPFVRMIMEVIRHDSVMHHRVQALLLDSLTQADVPLTHEELGEIWSAIEAHEASEREVIAIGERLRDTAWNPVHKALLEYLVTDEKKHDELLDQLRGIKQGLSRATQ